VCAHDSIRLGRASFLALSHGHEDNPRTPGSWKSRETGRLWDVEVGFFRPGCCQRACFGWNPPPRFSGQAAKPRPPQRDLTRALVCFPNAPFPHHACTLYFYNAASERRCMEHCTCNNVTKRASPIHALTIRLSAYKPRLTCFKALQPPTFTICCAATEPACCLVSKDAQQDALVWLLRFEGALSAIHLPSRDDAINFN